MDERATIRSDNGMISCRTSVGVIVLSLSISALQAEHGTSLPVSRLMISCSLVPMSETTDVARLGAAGALPKAAKYLVAFGPFESISFCQADGIIMGMYTYLFQVCGLLLFECVTVAMDEHVQCEC